MKKDLGWCKVELENGLLFVEKSNRGAGMSPDEARQLADALREVADSYVDPVEAKARELLAVYEAAWPPAERKGLEDFASRGCDGWMRLARHVLGAEANRHATVKALYYAAHWTPDRAVDEAKIWTDVRDAFGFKPGGSPHQVSTAPTEVPCKTCLGQAGTLRAGEIFVSEGNGGPRRGGYETCPDCNGTQRHVLGKGTP